ncbi:SDR family NAD(P)-dependent oxidoreductase [Rhodococcus sp. WS4]|nr:SDR family NAD(P)-dependent oxidoreductase [Rhodococcus sp. WS4]
MPMVLDGTVALVTGASSGIGCATATRLAADGAAVVITGRRRVRLDSLAAELRGRGAAVTTRVVDISTVEGAAEAVASAVAEYGRLDILVNAAGVMLNGPTADATIGEWDRMVDVNLKALMYVTKNAVPHLLTSAESSARRVADVVNISSIAGRVAAAHVAIYNATKFGVTAATEAWRQEYARDHLRFSVIEPGGVDTELFGHQSETTRRHYDDLFANVEKLHADDIADAVSYIVGSPRRVAVNELVIRPTTQR